MKAGVRSAKKLHSALWTLAYVIALAIAYHVMQHHYQAATRVVEFNSLDVSPITTLSSAPSHEAAIAMDTSFNVTPQTLIVIFAIFFLSSCAITALQCRQLTRKNLARSTQ